MCYTPSTQFGKEGSDTANKHHFELIQQGAKAWNRWREKSGEKTPDLSGANLKNADLRNVDFSWVNLMEANLRESNLSWANFTRANLRKANVRRAILREANFSWATLSWVDFREAYLRWANLRRADLSWANLKDVNLKDADLREANLSWADLRESNLRAADLRGANLQEAYLSNANFRETDLSEANLQGADLRGAHLFKTNLEQADMTGSHIYGISAWGTNLKETIQLDLVITDWDEPAITIDDLDVAQCFYLLLHAKNLRNLIQTMTAQIVLILGTFTPERKEILDTIRAELRHQRYAPIFFDCQKSNTLEILEMVSRMARMARFIIVDFSVPKVVTELLPHIVRTMSTPIQPLIGKNTEKEPPMLLTLRKHYQSILDTFWYRNAQDVAASLGQLIIGAAEEKVRELRSA